MPTRNRGATRDSGFDADQADASELSAEEVEARAAEAAAEAARAKVFRLRKQAEEAEAARTAAAELQEVEAEADDTDETRDIDETDETDERRRTLLAVAKYTAALLAVLGVAALASTSAWIIVKHRQADQQRHLSADFSAAARQGVVTLMSLNFNSAQSDVQRIIDNSTGQFKQDFEEQSGDFVKVAEESKVVTDATVTATAVKSMTQDTADVLVSAYSTVTNAQGAKEDPRTWRLIVSIARDGGQLKVAKVEFAP